MYNGTYMCAFIHVYTSIVSSIHIHLKCVCLQTHTWTNTRTQNMPLNGMFLHLKTHSRSCWVMTHTFKVTLLLDSLIITHPTIHCTHVTHTHHCPSGLVTTIYILYISFKIFTYVLQWVTIPATLKNKTILWHPTLSKWSMETKTHSYFRFNF